MNPTLDAAELTRASARVRQRFGTLIRRLRDDAATLGLVPGAGSE